MNNRQLCYRFLIAVWLLTCIYVLFAYMLNPKAISDGEIKILFGLQMLVLTFPIGFLATLFVGIICELLINMEFDLLQPLAQYGIQLLTWLTMVVMGFFQWFVWLPKLFTWVKSIWDRRFNV